MFYKHLHDPSCDLFVHGEEAPQSKEAHLQAALDAERAAKEAHQSTVVDLRKELASLQARVRKLPVCERPLHVQKDSLYKSSFCVKMAGIGDEMSITGTPELVKGLAALLRYRAALTPAAGGTRHGDTVRRVS